MTKAAKRRLELHDRERRQRNKERARACFQSVPAKPKKRRRTSEEVQRDEERHQAALDQLKYDRERINLNSRNQRLPRLCPRW